jgi:type IV secretion system protein TrbI
MEGLDSQGNAGLRHKVDRHYKRLFGFAALTSLFSAAVEVSQRRDQSVLTYPNPSDTAAAAVGREMSQTGAMINPAQPECAADNQSASRLQVPPSG